MNPNSRYIVVHVTETDDFERVVGHGMVCYQLGFDAIAQVLIQSDTGWWLDQYEPYLVFHRRDDPPDPDVAVRQFIQSRQSQELLNHPLSPPSPAPYPVRVPVPDDWDFAWLADCGLRHASRYRFAKQSISQQTELLFYNDESELPEEPSIDELPW